METCEFQNIYPQGVQIRAYGPVPGRTILYLVKKIKTR